MSSALRLCLMATTYSAGVVERLTSTEAADCEPCGQTLAVEDGEEQVPTDTAVPPRVAWSGILGMEGEMTGDGRLIENGALEWDEDTPGPLRYTPTDHGAHDGAVDVGRITSIERRDGGVIWGSGYIDTTVPEGMEAYRVVKEGLTNGVSMDLDDVDFEIRIAAEVAEQMDQALEDLLGEGDGEKEEPERETDEEGRVTVVKINADDEVMVSTHGRIRAATLVSIPAFIDAKISIDEDVEVEPAIVAAGAPDLHHFPASAFEDPKLTEYTNPPIVTKDGRVYGHVAGWNICHITHTQAGKCVLAPRSSSGYAWFHTSRVDTDAGPLAVGRLTAGKDHASTKPRVSLESVMRHYSDSSMCAAFVRAGEDEHGIWVAGVVNPDADPKIVRTLATTPLSGDWRDPNMNGRLEMFAALAVNNPGYARGLVASGEVRALVAAGLPHGPTRTTDDLTDAEKRWLRQAARRERAQTEDRVHRMARRVRASRLARRVHRY